MKKLWKWLLVLAILGGLGAAAWVFFGPSAAGGKKGAMGAPAEAKVEKRDFALSVLATGTVKPKVGAQVNVGARQSGKVEKLNVRIGDTVKKDQVIALIEHKDLDATLTQARATLASTKVQIAAKRLQEVADVARMNALLAQRQSEVNTEKSRLESARAQRTSELELERTRLLSIKAQRGAEVSLAGAGIQESTASYQLADKDSKRYGALYEKGMLAEQSLDKAKADVQAAASKLNYSKQQRRVASTKRAQEIAVQEETIKKLEADMKNELALQEEIVRKVQTILEVTQKELEALKASYKADLDILEASLPKLEAELDLGQIRLSYASVTTPIAGTVGTISTQEGETVAAGFSAPTFVTVVDLTRLQVDAYVDEVDVGKVKEGQTATFTVDAFPNEEFKGKVTAIYPTAILRDNVVYYDVVIDIEGDFVGRLRPEMTANVTIKAETRLGVLGIPIKALDRKAGTNVVHVKKDGGPAEAREIKLGLEDGDFVEVTSGLEEGEVLTYTASAPAKGD